MIINNEADFTSSFLKEPWKAFCHSAVSLRCFIFLLLVSFSCILYAESFQEKQDKWCENRISKDNSGSSILFEIVDNPLKETGTNNSDKVLKLSDIDQRGTIALNLTRYIGNATDRITDISGYDGLRFKYYIKNPPYTLYGMRIRMEEGQGSIINGTLTHADKNWKTVTFRFPKGSETSWIQISTYYVTVGQWNDSFPVMEIYLDDIELFDSTYMPTYESYVHASDINIRQHGKNIVLYDIESGSVIKIYDVNGRNILSRVFVASEMHYTFPDNGIYFIALNNNEVIKTRKIMIR